MWSKEIRVPSAKEALRFAPISFDFESARNLGLIGKGDALTERYLTAQAIYKAAFYSFLDKTADISQYEKMLDDSGYVFTPVEPGEQNVYQRYGSYGSRFIYLRNNFHIERLGAADLSLLDAADDDGALAGLAERTFKDVIAVRSPGDGGGVYDVVYDTGVLYGAAKAPNDALVLCLAYGWEFDDAGKLVSIDNEKAKETVSGGVSAAIQAQLSELLGLRVVVFVYS